MNLHRLARYLLGIVLAASGAAFFVWATGVRMVESRVLAALTTVAIGRSTYAARWGPLVFWNGGDGQLHGLDITPSCSLARLAAPLLIVAGLLVAVPRFRPGRVVLAVTSALLLLGLINQGRMVLIAFTVDRFGLADAQLYVHTLAGSLITVLGIATCLALAAWITFSGSRGGAS